MKNNGVFSTLFVVSSIVIFTIIDVIRKIIIRNNNGDDAMKNIMTLTIDNIKNYLISILAGAALSLR